MKRTAIVIALMLISSHNAIAIASEISSETDTDFECPDEKALRLVELASNYNKNGFNDPVTAFSYVIENATRPMDEVALPRACRRLAQHFYMIEHYGSPHADVFGLIPPQEAVADLKANHDILKSCPYQSLFESQLPIRRPAYVPPAEAVRNNVTGWVALELDVSEDGEVESVRITNSSDSILEAGIVDYVLQFRYPEITHYSGHSMRRKGLRVRIVTDYFQIAREKGCVLNR